MVGRKEEEEEEGASRCSGPLRLPCGLCRDGAPAGFWKDALEGHSFVPEHVWLLRMSLLGSLFWAFQGQKRCLSSLGARLELCWVGAGQEGGPRAPEQRCRGH